MNHPAPGPAPARESCHGPFSCHRPLGVVELRPAGPADFPVIADLARLIWWRCYPGILPDAQIAHMLESRYAPQPLAAEVASGRLTFTLLRVDGEPAAFAAHGPSDDPSELRLHQLYVHPDRQGLGLGSRLIGHVDAIARDLGRRSLVLTVNRRNARAIAAYTRNGFTIRESKDFPIGGGFVMEDYVMTRPVQPGSTPGTPGT